LYYYYYSGLATGGNWKEETNKTIKQIKIKTQREEKESSSTNRQE
jgi:hypothetical protein